MGNYRSKPGPIFRGKDQVIPCGREEEIIYAPFDIVSSLVKIHDVNHEKYHGIIDFPNEKFTSKIFFIRSPRTHNIFVFIVPSRGEISLKEGLLKLRRQLVSVKSVDYSINSLIIEFRRYSIHLQFKYKHQFNQLYDVLLGCRKKSGSTKILNQRKPSRQICTYVVPKRAFKISNLVSWNPFVKKSPTTPSSGDRSSEKFDESSNVVLQFYEVPATEWRTQHVIHWLSHIFIQTNSVSTSKVLLLSDYLKNENVFDPLMKYFKSPNVITYQDLINHILKYESRQNYPDILQSVLEKDNVRQILKRECYFLKDNHGLFNIYFHLVLKKRLRNFKNLVTEQKISLSDMEVDLTIEKRYLWYVDSCRDHILSILLLRKSFPEYMKERTIEFLKFEKAQLQDTVNSHWEEEESTRLLETSPEKWENVLRSFNRKHGISMENVSFTVNVLHEINLLRTRKKEWMKKEGYDKYLRSKSHYNKLLFEKESTLKKSTGLIFHMTQNPKKGKNENQSLTKDKLQMVVEQLKREIKRIKEKKRILEVRFRTNLEFQKIEQEVNLIDQQILDLRHFSHRFSSKRRREWNFDMRRHFELRMNEFLSSQSRRDNVRHFLTQLLIREIDEKKRVFENSIFFVLARRNQHAEMEADEYTTILDRVDMERYKQKSILKTTNFAGFHILNLGLYWDGQGLVRLENRDRAGWEEILAIPCTPFSEEGMGKSGKDREGRYYHHSVLERLTFLSEEIVGINVNYEYSSSTKSGKSGKLNIEEFNDRICQALGCRVFSNCRTYDFFDSLVKKYVDYVEDRIRSDEVHSAVSSPLPNSPDKKIFDGSDSRRRSSSRTSASMRISPQTKKKKVEEEEEEEEEEKFTPRPKSTPLYSQKKRIVSLDDHDLRYLPITPRFVSDFKPILVHKFKPDKELRIVFRTHEDVDTFTRQCYRMDPQFHLNYLEYYELLRGFDTAFWMRYNREIRDIHSVRSTSGRAQRRKNRILLLSTLEPAMKGCPFQRVKLRNEKYLPTSKFYEKQKQIQKRMIEERRELINLRKDVLKMRKFFNSKLVHLYRTIVRKRNPVRNLKILKIRRKVSEERKKLKSLREDHKRLILFQKLFKIKIALKIQARSLRNLKYHFMDRRSKIHRKMKDISKFCTVFVDSLNKLKKLKKDFIFLRGEAIPSVNHHRKRISENAHFLKTRIPEEFEKTLIRSRKVINLHDEARTLVHLECNKIDEPISTSSLNILKKNLTRYKKDVTEQRNIVFDGWNQCLNGQIPMEYILNRVSQLWCFSRIWGCKERVDNSSSLTYFGEVDAQTNEPDGMGFLIQQSGILNWSYHVQYQGEYQNGQKHGRGMLFSKKDLLYEGEFKYGLKDGKGVEYKSNGTTIEGNWKNDQLLMNLFNAASGSRASMGKQQLKRGSIKEKKVGVIDPGDENGGSDGSSSSSSSSGNGNEMTESLILNFKIFRCDTNFENQFNHSNRIGNGSFGSVYKVVHERKTYAAKIFHMELFKKNVTQWNQMVEKIRRSLRICASFQHPNIIQVYGMIDGNGNIGVLMEYMDIDVDRWMMENVGKISLKEKLRIMFETALGMKYLHDRKIIHRDLKWGNVLMKGDEVKITDFDTIREDQSSWRLKAKHTLQVTGTAEFIAPEMLSGKYTMKVDVFSFGMMIYCLLEETTDPYSKIKRCPRCGDNISMNQKMKGFELTIPYHVKNCGMRPVYKVDKNNKYREILEDLVRLMDICWLKDARRRPNFTEICRVLDHLLMNMDSGDKKGIKRVVVRRTTSKDFGHDGKKEEESEGEEDEFSCICGNEICERNYEKMRDKMGVMRKRILDLEKQVKLLKKKK